MQIDDFEDRPVPSQARKGFGSMFSVWITFQVSTVMLYFGAITLAHLTLGSALLVVAIAAGIIATVSGVTGYVGARTGLSTTLVCEHIFGTAGGKLQQIFQGLVEFGWFVVIVGLTGATIGALLKLDSGVLRFLATFLAGSMSIISVYFGFRGIRWISILSNPVIITVFLATVTLYLGRTTGLVWIPTGQGPDLLKSISIATGTFITGAALSADLMRFADSNRTGALAGIISFLLTIPTLLLIGAVIAMTNHGNADFIASVSRIGFGGLLLVWLILTNWTTADTTLYLAIIPLKKLTPIPRGALVVSLGLAGSVVAALGIASFITTWLTWLSILLPPLAGPIFAVALKLLRGQNLQPTTTGFEWRGLVPWVVGVIAGAGAQYIDLGSPPVIGILVSFGLSVLFGRSSRPKTSFELQ